MATSVYGVPLEPGERVVYFHRSDPGWQKPFLIIVGVLMLIGIIGIFILYAGLTAATTVYVVTTRRFLIVDGKEVQQLRLGQVTQATLEGQRWYKLSGRGGELLLFHLRVDSPAMFQAVDAALRQPASLERWNEVSFQEAREG